MDATTKFWKLFQKRAATLAAIQSADDPVYDEVLGALQSISPDLWLEVSLEPGRCELIITAAGNAELFPLVDAIVAAAPRVLGWKVLGGKPKTGLPPTVRWDDHEVDLAGVVFQAMSMPGGSPLRLRIFVPGLDEAHQDEATNALLVALEHCLGERAFAAAIEEVDVLPMPTKPPEPAIALQELEQYLAFRARGLP